MEVEESKLDFQRAFAGETNVKTVTLKNNGDAETMCNIKSDCPFITFDPAPPFFVEPRGTRDVAVMLTPEALGDLVEEIIIESLESKVGS